MPICVYLKDYEKLNTPMNPLYSLPNCWTKFSEE